MPADYLKFRPWMATVHLAAPVPNWWDVPAQSGENFQKLLDHIESDRKVFDLQTIVVKERLEIQGTGYIPGALKRAQAMATPANGSIVELRNEDVQIRCRAAWTSMIHGTNAINELLQATNDEDKVVRWFALESIRANIVPLLQETEFFGKNSVSMEHVAEKIITDEDEYVRQSALDLFSEIGERGIARLLQLVMKDDASKPKQEAFWTLRDWVEAQGEVGVETLMQFVHGNDTALRSAALLVMGKATRLAAPKLIELLSDSDENIRIEALSALLEMGEGAVPFLKEVVESKQQPACMPREAGCRTEAGLAQRALDGFKKLKANEELRTVLPSLKIARLIAMGEEFALLMLNQQLKTPDKKIRFFAAKALSYIGQASVPIFIDSLSSSDANIRRRACEALRDISAPEARDALKKALTDVDIKVRQNAVRALARIGNPDDLPVLYPLLSDESKAVRKTVREALGVKRDA
jgi:HEAT repeat protein